METPKIIVPKPEPKMQPLHRIQLGINEKSGKFVIQALFQTSLDEKEHDRAVIMVQRMFEHYERIAKEVEQMMDHEVRDATAKLESKWKPPQSSPPAPNNGAGLIVPQ